MILTLKTFLIMDRIILIYRLQLASHGQICIKVNKVCKIA